MLAHVYVLFNNLSAQTHTHSNHSEHVVCLSGADDSQYSQTSLFGSDAPSSMELFSQHSNSQGLSQNQPLETSCQNSTTTLMGTLEAKTKCDSTHIQSNPQVCILACSCSHTNYSMKDTDLDLNLYILHLNAVTGSVLYDMWYSHST